MRSRLAVLASAVALVAVATGTASAGSPVTGDGRQAWRDGLHFSAKGVSLVTAAELGKSWRPGCPVGPDQLRALEVGYWGFDGQTHTGVVVVNVAAIPAIRTAFAAIEQAKFPIRLMEPVAAYGGNDNRSMAHDNTSAFNCRLAVTNGPKSWSEHAYGEAVDIDTFENPYELDGKVLPPAATQYADRSKHRRGMIFEGGPVVRAFDSVGWGWGGRWSGSPDYQHFSVNGR
ncbi:MAG TPA: M15 family metallopeptidase [Mycobacteriales bacterium]|nr:M15 family metallopeptidase [Mycobacteriales bacterium]